MSDCLSVKNLLEELLSEKEDDDDYPLKPFSKQLVPLDFLWNINSEQGWESGLTPQTMADAFKNDDDVLWAQIEVDELLEDKSSIERI